MTYLIIHFLIIGIVNSEGDLWKSNRRFLLKQRMGMKHWGGQGMAQIESVVQREVVCFLEDLLKDHNSKPVCPNNLVNSAFSNVICSMIMSTRFRYTDKKFQRFMFLFDEGFRLFTSGAGALVFLPFIKYLSGVRSTLVQLRDNRQEMLEFVQKVIAEHKETLDPEHPRDLIDSYLLEIEKIKNEEEHQELFHGFDPDKQLEQIILDLFSASVETLKTSLLWAIVYMLHNPEERRKVQQELDEKVGPNRLPRLSDMANLPYTRATLYEIMRRSSVVPMGTTHATSQEVKFEGFTIPKNTHVIPLLHAVHMDPELWDKPEEFRPSRFLVENGTGVQKPEGFMPFGVGNRMCLGDNLAEKEFFLFFSSILHTFDLELPEGAELPNLRGVAGVTVTPNKFEVVFKPRAGRTNNNVSFENGSPLRTPDSEDDPAAFYSEELMNKFNTDNALAMCQRTLSEHSSIHTRLYG